MHTTTDHDHTDPAVEDQAHELAFAVLRLARRLRGRTHQHSTVTLNQLAALIALDTAGPLTPGQLADHERVRPPTMSRVIASLHELGLISKAAHPRDGRQVIISLTDNGHHLLAAEHHARRNWLHHQLAALTDEHRRTLADATEILNRLHDPNAAASRDPRVA